MLGVWVGRVLDMRGVGSFISMRETILGTEIKCLYARSLGDLV